MGGRQKAHVRHVSESRSWQAPPGIVLAFTVALLAAGLWHGQWKVEKGGMASNLSFFPPVDLTEVHWLSAWAAGSALGKGLLALGWAGRTTQAVKRARAARALSVAPPSTPAVLPGVEGGEGEFRVWWSFLDADGAEFDLPGAVQAASRWTAGDTEVPRIPRPAALRLVFVINTTFAGSPTFSGVWGGMAFGTIMAGSDMYQAHVAVNASTEQVTSAYVTDSAPTRRGRPSAEAQQDATDVVGGYFTQTGTQGSLWQGALTPGQVSAAPPTGAAAPGGHTAFACAFSRALDTGDADDHALQPPPFLDAYFRWVDGSGQRPGGLSVTDTHEDTIFAWSSKAYNGYHFSNKISRSINFWAPASNVTLPQRNVTVPVVGFLQDMTLQWDFIAADGTAVDLAAATTAAAALLANKTTAGLPLLATPDRLRANLRLRIPASDVGAGWEGCWASLGFGTQMVGADIIFASIQVDPATGEVLGGFPQVTDAAAASYAAPTPDADGDDVALAGGGYIDLDAVSVEETLTTASPPTVRTPPNATDGGFHLLSVTLLRKLQPADKQDAELALPPSLAVYFRHAELAKSAGVPVPLQGGAPAASSAGFQPMILAYSQDSPGMSYHGTDARARARVNLFSIPGQDVVEPGSLDTSQELDLTYAVHGIAMGLSWAVAAPICVITLHYAGENRAFAIDLHHNVMNLVATITIPVAATAFATSEAQARPITTHGYMGLAISFSTLLQVGLGQAARAFYTSTFTATWALRRFKQAHILIGITMLPIALVTCYAGVSFWEDRAYGWIPLAWYGLLLLVVLTLEVRQRTYEASLQRDLKRMGLHTDLDKATVQAKKSRRERSGSVDGADPGDGSPKAPATTKHSVGRLLSKLQSSAAQNRRYVRRSYSQELSPQPGAYTPVASSSRRDVSGEGWPTSLPGAMLLAPPGGGGASARKAPMPPAALLAPMIERIASGTLSGQEGTREIAAFLEAWGQAAAQAQSWPAPQATPRRPSMPGPDTRGGQALLKSSSGHRDVPSPSAATPGAVLLGPMPSGASLAEDAQSLDEADGTPLQRVFTADGIPVISYAEFQEQVSAYDEKLTIIGGGVYDVSGFAARHPGSAFVITHSIGKDVTDAFVGASTVDPRVPLYSHSARARAILSTLLVAVLDTSRAGVLALQGGGAEPGTGGTATPQQGSQAQQDWWAWLPCCGRRGKPVASPAALAVDIDDDSGSGSLGSVHGRLASPLQRGALFLGRSSSSDNVSLIHGDPWTVQSMLPATRGVGSGSDAAPRRPVMAFTLAPSGEAGATSSGASPVAQTLRDWSTYGRHVYISRPAEREAEAKAARPGQLANLHEHHADSDARAFSIVRMPQIFVQHLGDVDNSQLQVWAETVRSPPPAEVDHPHLHLLVRRYPEPMAAMARYIHDEAGPQRGTLHVSQPIGQAMELPKVLARVPAAGEVQGAALQVLAAGTGVTSFLDLAYALLAHEGIGAPALPHAVRLHFTCIFTNPEDAVALPFLAFLAHYSAASTRHHSVSLHLHFTRMSAQPTIADLHLPSALEAGLSPFTALGVDFAVDRPFLRLSHGSLRERAATRAVLGASLHDTLQHLPQTGSGRQVHGQHMQRLAATWICGPPGMGEVLRTAFAGGISSAAGDVARRAMAVAGAASDSALQDAVDAVGATVRTLGI